MASDAKRLSKLEAVRGFAAALVVANHAAFFSAGILGIFSSLGQEAVTLFFVLSGFVIHYSTFGKSEGPARRPVPKFRTYLLHRFRRIYPLMIVSMVLAYALACIGERALLLPRLAEFFGNVFMLQDNSALKRGVWFDTYYGNSPLWSLSYEWWFYMMFFPLATMLRNQGSIQKYVVAALSAIGFLAYQAHPNAPCLFLGYFYLWWTGVELSREYSITGRLTWRRQFPTLALLALLTALWSLPVINVVTHKQPIRLGIDPVLQFRHFATATLFVIIGLTWYRIRFVGFRFILGPFALLAPLTYALYIIHVPIFYSAKHHFANLPNALVMCVCIVIVIPIAYMLEVRLQPLINSILNRVFNVPPRKPLANAAASQT